MPPSTARGNPLVDVDAGSAGNASGHHRQPEKRAAGVPHKRQKQETYKGQADRQGRAPKEKEGNPARIVDTGLDEAAAQHLHVLVVCRPVMLGRVVDELGDSFLTGILQRTRVICLAVFVAQNASGATLDGAANAYSRHHREGQDSCREKYQQAHQEGVAVAKPVAEYGKNHVPRSDPEVDHAVHHEIADAHPAPGKRKSNFCQVLTPNVGVKIGHQKLNDGEHADRQSRKNQRGSAAFGSKRANLASHLKAFFKNFAQVAARRPEPYVISSVTMPNSVPIGSAISRATIAIAIGTGCPARNERTMMSMPSGNCALNFFCRRLRKNHSTSAGKTRPPPSVASNACDTLPSNVRTPAKIATMPATMTRIRRPKPIDSPDCNSS